MKQHLSISVLRWNDLTAELESINSKITTIKQISNRIFHQKEFKTYLLKHLLQDLLAYANIIVQRYQQEQHNLYGRLVSGTLLLGSLQNLKESVRYKKLDLPFNPNNKPEATFYEYVDIQSAVIDKHLFFVYILPLVGET